MVTITRSTVLDAPADRVWEAVKTPAAFRLVTRGVLGIPALRGRREPWEQGETVVVRLFLLGVVPAWRHHLTVAEIDDDARVLRSDEHGGVLRSWRHDITVTPLDDDRCGYEDRIDIDAGRLTPVAGRVADVFYRIRQSRWRELALALYAAVRPGKTA